MSYAGFWKRFVAAIIDGIIIELGSGIIVSVFIFGMWKAGSTYGQEIIEVFALILRYLSGWIYYIVMESSSLQGTLGKMILKIKVTDLAGDRVGFGRAIGRNLGKIISITIIFIGFIMVAFTKKKQGLHDMMARCLVVNK